MIQPQSSLFFDEALLGAYENLRHDRTDMKKDWHYVTIRPHCCTNRAGVSWGLTTTSQKKFRRVSPNKQCCAHKCVGQYTPHNHLHYLRPRCHKD